MTLATAAQFCHRMGVGLRAGADLIMLLDSEASHGSNPYRRAMQQLSAGASRGEQLSAVMAQESYFPPLMSAMTRVGEETGRLERTLLSLAKHYEHQKQIRKEFISSITYPALQLVGAVLVVSLLIYLMGILTPAGGGQMADILGFGLRGGSGVLWFWFYIGIVLALVLTAIWAFTRNIAGVQNIVPLIYMIPKIGGAIQTITISRFCWTMALALDSGLDPIRSIRLSLDSTDSEYYQTSADDAEQAIRGGATLAGALQATSVFPGDFIKRVEISEHSGTDAESMDYLASEYDDRARTAMKVLSGLATIIVRASVILFLLYMIYRVGSFYIGTVNQAMEPILPNRR
jgi:type II secretory pathway component PulF